MVLKKFLGEFSILIYVDFFIPIAAWCFYMWIFGFFLILFITNNCCSVTKLCLTLCSLMDCSMPGFPVLHHLLEFAQTHVHWVGDAIQPSYLQFSRSVVSDSLPPHEPQHARPPCPSPTPGVHPNPCPLSQWCHPTISSSVIPFSCPQSFSASGSFQMSQLLASGSQSIGVSASTSVLSMNTRDWSPLGWTGWISLQSKGLSRVFSISTVQTHQFFSAQFSL